MDIHAPTGPAHTLKDFAVHILIVTIGILIALGLEGVRESWKEHKQLAETRASFERELRGNRENLRAELASVKALRGEIEQVLAMLPNAVKYPDPLTEKVARLSAAFYFFKTTAWESAIASGALAHMDEDELTRFDEAYQGVKNYQDAEKLAFPEWHSMESWFASHHAFTSADQVTGEEKLRSFEAITRTMEHVGQQFAEALNASIGP